MSSLTRFWPWSFVVVGLIGIGISGANYLSVSPEQVAAVTPARPLDISDLKSARECQPEKIEAVPSEPTLAPTETSIEPTETPYAPTSALYRIGTVTLDSLDLSWPIFEGVSELELSNGVGHFPQSVLPGVEDNSVLSGHRSTVFNRLGELEVGDLIYLETEDGVFTYEVTRLEVVDRDSKLVIVPTDKAVLTLTTCYPFDSLNVTTDAFIVSAALVQ